MENANPQANVPQQPVMPSNHSRPNTLLMGIGAVVLLGLGLLGGYLLWGNNRIAAQNVNQQTQVSPTETQVNSPTTAVPTKNSEALTWKKQTIESKRVAPGSDVATPLYVDFQILSV